MTETRELVDELRLIGCHANGDARCTCVIGQEAADAITAAQERIEAMEGLLRDVIEMWDWCSEDPYDRGYGPVSDAVYNARATLAQGGGE